MIPPRDVFHRFKRYRDANYEQIRAAVRDLYCERPDIEYAICPHNWHASKEDAETYKQKHRNEVIADIYTVTSGMWSMLGPFAENRKNTKYYNDNTIVLEEIMNQTEEDHKLGKDLMEKRVEKNKKKNIAEAGADDPAFAKWKAQNTSVAKMGAINPNDRSMAPLEAGDDIAVDVFRISGQTTKKSTFFTQSEPPTFMLDRGGKAKPK